MMTAPKRRIKETEELFTKGTTSLAPVVEDRDLLEQILKNQIIILQAVNVLLSWSNNE